MKFRDIVFRVLLALAVVLLFVADILNGPWGLAAMLLTLTFVALSFWNLWPASLLSWMHGGKQEAPTGRLKVKTPRPHYYHVTIDWNKDRKGVMCSPELCTPAGAGCIEVATPPQFPKGIPGIWSPEHLFTAAVSSCLMTTFLAVAEKARLDFSSFSCPSEGKLERGHDGWMMTEIKLHPTITVPTENLRTLGARVLNDSLEACLISNSIKSKVIANPVIRVSSNGGSGQ